MEEEKITGTDGTPIVEEEIVTSTEEVVEVKEE